MTVLSAVASMIVGRWPSGRVTRRRRRTSGAVAQLGERCNRTAEVRGSTPLSSIRVRQQVGAWDGRRGEYAPAGHRSSEVEHSIRNRAVVSSILTGGSVRGSSSVGRASASQAEGRGFEPRLPLCGSPQEPVTMAGGESRFRARVSLLVEGHTASGRCAGARCAGRRGGR
jgi:hypothetical protein